MATPSKYALLIRLANDKTEAAAKAMAASQKLLEQAQHLVSNYLYRLFLIVPKFTSKLDRRIKLRLRSLIDDFEFRQLDVGSLLDSILVAERKAYVFNTFDRLVVD